MQKPVFFANLSTSVKLQNPDIYTFIEVIVYYYKFHYIFNLISTHQICSLCAHGVCSSLITGNHEAINVCSSHRHATDVADSNLVKKKSQNNHSIIKHYSTAIISKNPSYSTVMLFA